MKDTIYKIKSIIKDHFWIIILAFLLTILIFAPLIAFPYVIGKDYQGINENAFGTDAHFYLTRGKEVLEGHNLGSPLLREGKNEPDAIRSYSDQILLAPIKLLGLGQKVNITTVYNIYNFIGVFLIILLIYYFVWQLSGSKLLSAAAALSAIGGYSMIYYKTIFYDNFNVYARVIYPFISSFFLFLYFNLLLKSLKSAELKYKIFAALTFGLLFYIYFYAWSFVLALNACLFLILLFKKDFFSAKKVLLISSVGLAFGAYNLIGLVASLYSGVGEQAAYFLWMSSGRGPIFSKIGFITLILFALYFYKRRDDENWPLIFAIILSGWVTLNQQIITGRMLQYGHYYFYFIVPLAIIISLYMAWRLFNRENLRKYLFIFIIAVVFINTAGGQYKSFFSTLEPKRYEQNYRPIIDFLNRDKTPGVILTSEENSFLFTIHTPHDLFWNSSANFNNVPIQRFKDALFAYSYLNKQARNDFKGYYTKIGDNKAETSFYQSYYRNLEGYWSGVDYYAYINKIKNDDQELARKRPEIIDQLSKEYNETILKNNGFNKLLKKYGVNYVVWDKNKYPEWDLSAVSGLKPLTSYNNIYLYELK